MGRVQNLRKHGRKTCECETGRALAFALRPIKTLSPFGKSAL